MQFNLSAWKFLVTSLGEEVELGELLRLVSAGGSCSCMFCRRVSFEDFSLGIGLIRGIHGCSFGKE